jgi:hypothetical protein
MRFPVNLQYALKPEPGSLWTVLDMSTGKPADVNGIVLRRLDLGMADDLVNTLNAHIPPIYTPKKTI